jgi:hypothetical protein
MEDVPITSGLFGLLLASAIIGMIVRAARSYRHSTRLTFTHRANTNDEGSYSGVVESDIESNQALLE